MQKVVVVVTNVFLQHLFLLGMCFLTQGVYTEYKLTLICTVESITEFDQLLLSCKTTNKDFLINFYSYSVIVRK